MANIPPPYALREHISMPPVPSTSTGMEFSETSSVSIEWRFEGLKALYDQTKGEVKSYVSSLKIWKCEKSAVFGDADNLWEVLWYPNSGVAGGEFSSLYLSCVPTPYERQQAIGSKWTRKGLWWFRFEIRSLIPDERNNKLATLATKDASDHTFAVKTANWGWQQFAKRDTLFQHPAVLATDGFTIHCTINAQPQPPAGYWLGMGLPAKVPFVGANNVVGTRMVGSGGGLSAWAGGEGASGGVAGGTTAAGGIRRVVPKDLVNSVGALLDDPLYSDVEFVFPSRGPQDQMSRPSGSRPARSRKIYATKKLLTRCEYFRAMFTGGFREAEVAMEETSDDEDFDMLSDSDMEEEAENDDPSLHATSRDSALPAQTTTTDARRLSGLGSGSGDGPHLTADEDSDDDEMGKHEENPPGGGNMPGTGGGVGHVADESIEEIEVPVKKERLASAPPRQVGEGQAQGPTEIVGPKKTRVVIRDAAWSTWWAVLYWLYTDLIYFAPLSSSFDPTAVRNRPFSQTHSRPGSVSSAALTSAGARDGETTRREWIQTWLDEHGIANGLDDVDEDTPVGPRPVSAKAVYRLADKLGLPALRLRAFQHISAGLSSHNIPAEVFSRFSSTFEEVRKIQVNYFLEHWTEIKKSETMTQIWQQIRLGKHVGFEEVWPLIVGQLDFKPS